MGILSKKLINKQVNFRTAIRAIMSLRFKYPGRSFRAPDSGRILQKRVRNITGTFTSVAFQWTDLLAFVIRSLSGFLNVGYFEDFPEIFNPPLSRL